MPDNYLDSALQTGFSDATLLSLKLDTEDRLNKALNPTVDTKSPLSVYDNGNAGLPQDETVANILSGKYDKYNLGQAAISPDSKIREAARYVEDKKLYGDPISKGVGLTKFQPYDTSMDKFLNKQFGYRPERGGIAGNEDFYYQNDYMKEGWFARDFIKNPLRFAARVVVPAVIKFGEGLGYVGSMITSIGSDNYWADVADNGLSNWLESKEQKFKDQWVPVYQQAGFDKKGFFSKLLDWTFWNDSIADSVAFMASAAVPAGITGILGKASKFATAFSDVSKLGKFASKVGVGSWAELTSLTFNTAMESAMEGSQVYKEMSQRMKAGRAEGDPRYANLTDQDIKERSGKLAGNSIRSNFGILLFSNAFENTIFFKPFKTVEGRAKLHLDANFNPGSAALDQLGKKGFWQAFDLTNSLRRVSFYGKKITGAALIEGGWEENAQLAIQRYNQGDTEGRGFWHQLAHQTKAALTGSDEEALENIGLGALVGIGMTGGMAKITGERKTIIENTRVDLKQAQLARQNLFDNNDIWQRDEQNQIIFKGNEPQVDEKKFLVKKQAMEHTFGVLTMSNKDDYFNSPAVEFATKKSFADYIRSLNNVGIEDIAGKVDTPNTENAGLFGFDPTKINEKAPEFAELAKTLEKASKDANKVSDGDRPSDTTPKQFADNNLNRKTAIYNHRSENIILADFVSKSNASLLEDLNKTRTLTNTSLSQFPVDQVNFLLYQKALTDAEVKKPGFTDSTSDLEKEYYSRRSSDLQAEIDEYKKDNIQLSDSVQNKAGYYIATVTDEEGNKKQQPASQTATAINAKLAEWGNVVHYNNHFDSLLSHPDNGYDNYLKLQDTPNQRAVEELQKNPPQTNQQKTLAKFREQKPGDFAAITQLATKMVFADNKEYTPEELQLQQNYPGLLEELLKHYENVVENQRLLNLKTRLASLNKVQSALADFLEKHTASLTEKKSELQTLQDELQKELDGDHANVEKISDSIQDLAKKIAFVEKRLGEEQDKQDRNLEAINAAEAEIKSGSFRKLYTTVEETRKQIEDNGKKLTETVSMIDSLKKLIKRIVARVKKIFPTFNFKALDRIFSDEVYGQEDMANYHPGVVEEYKGLKGANQRKADLEQSLVDLKSAQEQLSAKFQAGKAEVKQVLDETDKFFRDKYINLTKQTPTKQDAGDATITDNLNQGLFPAGATHSEGEEEPGDDVLFDGNTYQRPLHTKFFTSTFPAGTEADILSQPQEVQDYFAFTNYLTDPANSGEIKKKLGNGKLKTLVVNRNNVNQLGLAKVLNKDKYFAEEGPESTHFEIVPVIEEGGALFFVDSALNKLGKVSTEKSKVSDKIVRASMRLPRFNAAESEQYGVKYSQDDMNAAIKTVTDWRADILNKSLTDPILTFSFAVTRGIANKMKMEDGSLAKNPVVGTLVPEAQLNGQTVRVYSVKEQVVNDENVVIPVGRPFISTNNTVHQQLHAANNNKLSPDQVKTVSTVLQEMLKDHLAKINEYIDKSQVFPKDLKKKIQDLGGIERLDPADKKQAFLKITSDPTTKGKLFNSNFVNYLSSIIYYDKLEKDKKSGRLLAAHKNQVYLQGYLLHFGTDTGNFVDITDPTQLSLPGIQKFLSDQFHNIKYYNDPKKANKPFTEYYMDKDRLESREWPTYSHYLLQEKTPDGKSRESIPITTGIKTKEQQSLEKDPSPYAPYNFRGISLRVDQEITGKKRSKDSEYEVLENQETAEDVLNETINALKEGLTGKKAPAKTQTKTPAKTNIAPGSAAEDLMNDVLNELNSLRGNKEETPPANTEDIDLPASDMFRVVTPGMFKTEEDLNAVIEDIRRMVPQFPVERLSNVIRSLEGIEAWGQFVNNTIRLYEMAEKGTGYHEVFEAVVNRLLSDKEWSAISREFSSRPGYFTDRETGLRTRYADATNHQAKEELAEEFMKFKLGQKTPTQHQTKSFFKIIWDFIKNLFSSKTTIDSIFNKIDQGKFANRTVQASDRFTANFRRLPGVSELTKKDLMDGATSFMLGTILRTPKSLAALDEINLTDEKIYEPIRKQFEDTLATLKDAANKIADIKKKTDFNNAAGAVQYSLDNWKEFVDTHKEFIKHFRIKFEESDMDKTEEELETVTRSPYNQDKFSISGKKSASKSVRFLLGTLLNMEFAKDGSVKDSGGEIVGNVRPILNRVFMGSLVNYDQFMYKALTEFQGLNDFSRIEQKLKDLSGITEIAQAHDVAKVIAGMDNDKAIWTSLYMRLFGLSDKVDEEAEWKMIMKLDNYLGKHAPDPYVFMHGGSTAVMISSVERSSYEAIISKVASAVNFNRNKLFRQETKDGFTRYYASAKYAKKVELSGFTAKVMADFMNVLGLTDVITPDLIKAMSGTDKSEMKRLLLLMRNSIPDAEAPTISLRTANISGRTAELAKLLYKYMDHSEDSAAYFGIENNLKQKSVLPSFVSRIVSELNNVKTRDELYKKFPNTATYFAQDSIVLARLFDDNGDRTPVRLGYIEGIKNGDEQEGTKISQLELHDRYFLEFNASLRGMYYSIPGDSETEWTFDMGEFVPYSENLLAEKGNEIIKTIFLPKLKSEIDTVIAFAGTDKNFLQLNQFHKISGRKIGESLRFFKDILASNPKLISDIYKAIESGTKSDKIISSNSKKIITAVKNYLTSETEVAMKFLKDNRLAREDETGVSIESLESKFVDEYKIPVLDGVTYMNQQQFRSLVEYQKLNSMIGHMELFKLFFGDPAQYKDFEKRAKSMLGPTEKMYYDSTGKFNNWLNINKNFAELGEEKIPVPESDWFNTYFTNTATERTVDDFIVVTPETHNSLVAGSEFAKKIAKAYENTNETDGQSLAPLGFTRHLFIKSGWRWTDEHEKFYQHDTALMRQELSELPKDNKNHYEYTSKELKAIDKKIVEEYSKNPPNARITSYKTLMAFVDEDGHQNINKHSVYNVSYQLAKEFELLDAYVDMLKREDNMLHFKSVKKVGLQLDNEGKITSFYNDSFGRNDLEETGKNTPQVEVDLRTIGIQQETQGDHQGQTLGTQVTKDINLNLFSDGVPVDYNSSTEGEQRTQAWNALSHEQKIAESPNYAKVYGDNGTIPTLQNMKMKSAIQKFNELGVRWNYDPEEGITYHTEDLTKIKDYILAEMQRLQIDQNTLDTIKLSDDKKSFEFPAETTPSYSTISNLLWSIADKAINHMSVNGKSYVQVSSAFFNKGPRKAAYKADDGTWQTIDSVEDLNRLRAEGKQVVMTSSELKFYELKDGKVSPMEIYLPHIYKQRVNQARTAKNLPILSDQELMDHLNSDPRLLESVGFRIPTQSTSSMDFFKIKGFLHESFGDSIVVPSAITTKAGSDFDVDKFSTYLNNWKLNEKGLPYYEEFVSDKKGYRKNYENMFLPKNSLVKYIQREYNRIQVNKQLPGLTKEGTTAANSLIDQIFGSDISRVAEDTLTDSKFPDDYTYQNLLEDAVAEEKNVPYTFEQFMQFPEAMKQSRGALENRYFQAIRNVLSDPAMFEALLSPTSTDHIKSNKKAVFDALGKDVEDKELNYAKFLSTEYIADKRNQLARSKGDIGIFAITMTNLANSQVTGLRIAAEGGYKDIDKLVVALNNNEVDLPFGAVKIQMVDGIRTISISATTDEEGKLIMDKISAYISGVLDVTKETDIIEMGMHTELAGSYALLERTGMKGATVALFMYQPVIREFLKELLFTNRKSYFGGNSFSGENELVKSLVDKYGGARPYDSNYQFTDKELAAYISRTDEIEKGNFTSKEREAQYYALVNFLKVRMWARHLRESTMASDHDTSKIRSPWLLIKKDLQLERSKTGNNIVKVENGKVLNGAQTLIDNTSVGTDIRMMKDFNKIMASTGLFALQKENPMAALSAIASRIFSQNSFISNDDFVSAMKEYEASMIDSLVSTVEIHGMEKGNDVYNSLYKFRKQYFTTNRPGNLKSKFDYIKQSYGATTRSNYFLSNLDILTDSNLGVDKMSLKIHPTNDDVTTKNRLTEALINLAQDKRPVIAEFYKAVIYGAYMQFGIKYSRNSFLNLLPAVSDDSFPSLLDLTKPALENVDTEDFSMLDEQVQRNKWDKKGIIPELRKQFTMRFLRPDKEGTYTLDKDPTWKTGRSNPPTLTSQTFFAKYNRATDAMATDIHPVMLWGGYTETLTPWSRMPNIVKVAAVRPEFIQAGEDRYGRPIKVVDPVVKEMMKRKDFSAIFYQIYKKVGLENPTFARYMQSKDNKGRMSINYLYKPINKYGARDFSEVRPLYKTQANTVVGEKSMLNFPAFDEIADEDLISSINNQHGNIFAVLEQDTAAPSQMEKSSYKKPIPATKGQSGPSQGVKSLDMAPESAVKVAEGTKTTTVRSKDQAKLINIPVGKTEVRTIAGDKYNITNRGLLTIEEAGGLKAILASEGVSTPEAFKYPETKEWIAGKGKLYVYDITPIDQTPPTKEEAPVPTPTPTTPPIPTVKIISGGQTGGDIGGLQGAKSLGMETGGTAPPGWISGGKREEALLKSFGLTEGATDPATYPKRTMKNVDDSDGTVAILWGPSVGTDKTIGYAQTHKWQSGNKNSLDTGYKPVLVIKTKDINEAAQQLKDFVQRNNIKVLNVAGHRENSQPGISEFTKNLIINTFTGNNITPTSPVTNTIKPDGFPEINPTCD